MRYHQRNHLPQPPAPLFPQRPQRQAHRRVAVLVVHVCKPHPRRLLVDVRQTEPLLLPPVPLPPLPAHRGAAHATRPAPHVAPIRAAPPRPRP